MQGPLVTAVIVTRGRRPKLLSKAIESVANQTHDAIELVVVDDSPEMVSERVAAEWDDALDVRCLAGDGEGVTAARNRGLRAANGQFVAHLDDDDRWLPEKTARQLEAFEDDPDLGLVCVGQRYEDETGTVVNEHRPTLSGEATERLLRGERLAPTSSSMARTDLVREHDCYFDERLAYWDDKDWYIQLSQHSTVKSIPDPLVVRGIGDYDRLVNDFQSIHDRYYDVLVEKHRPLAREYDCEEEFVAALSEAVAGAALASERYPESRRYALRAVRNNSSLRFPYLCLVASAGGRYTHRSMVTVRRRANRLVSALT